MPPTIRNLFHFTDRRNLPMIKEKGGLYSYARLKEMGIEIPAPGGNDWSHEADAYKGMDRYVHLCFRPTHSMEHVARVDVLTLAENLCQNPPMPMPKPALVLMVCRSACNSGNGSSAGYTPPPDPTNHRETV